MEDTRWGAWLEGDGGDSWWLTLRELAGADSVHQGHTRWIHRHREFAFTGLPEWMPPDATSSLQETLSRRSAGIGRLMPGEQEMLDAVAAQLHPTEWANGESLRKRLDLKKVRFRYLARVLRPRHLRESDDTYTLTLPGLLASARVGEARRVLEGVLRLLARRVQGYTWDELRAEAGLDDAQVHFAGGVISAAGLTRGEGEPLDGNPGWEHPPDAEALSECRTLEGFLAYIREKDTGRAWPTAPVLLPEELEPPPLTVVRGHRVVIGHGRSGAWRQLQGFLGTTLGLAHEELPREPSAGAAMTGRLSRMLDGAAFACIVMTAEDEAAEGPVRVRQSVVHEVGLFQGRLGFQKVVLLLEEGCEPLPDIQGLTVIRFPQGEVLACREELQRVLVRERLLPGR
jgi:hypothetical protein